MRIYDECRSSLDLIRLRVGVIPLTLSLIRLVIARRSLRRANPIIPSPQERIEHGPGRFQ